MNSIGARGGSAALRQTLVIGFGAALALALAPTAHANACPANPAGVMSVTSDCEDPLYNSQTFIIDKVSEETAPMPHTKVTAHFRASANTPAWKVSFYLPPADKWEGRFFQHVYPLDLPNHPDDRLFAFTSGGMLVDVRGDNCACGGYRADAGAAKMAKAYAAQFYKTSRPIYGYIFGGSGGSFQTIAAMENTSGIWQGGLPYVIGTDASFQTAGMLALARLVLKDKLPAILDALAPGGSGNPFVGLDAAERAILLEALRMGIVPRVFEHPEFGGFPSTSQVKTRDPAYVDDFWSKPGYEGANPPKFLSAAKYDQYFRVTSQAANGELVFDRGPDSKAVSSSGDEGIEYWVYDAAGKRVPGSLVGNLSGNRFMPKPQKQILLAALNNGGKLRVNNLWYLAMMFYHRHAIPQAPTFPIYDQFKAADGTPLYPQREVLPGAGPVAIATGGSVKTGKITGKVIAISNLADMHANPWQADWYSKLVNRALGKPAWGNDFRIYYNDNAEHFDDQVPDPASLVVYVPSLYQALRDLSAWVERGVQPPASTRYKIIDGQVKLPAEAAARRGIQPVVHLTSHGSDRVEVAVGQSVIFQGRVQSPSGTGKIVKVEWYSGEGPVSFSEVAVPANEIVRLQTTYRFPKPGTYFPVLRAAAQRIGDMHDVAQVQNLARMRVIVR